MTHKRKVTSASISVRPLTDCTLEVTDCIAAMRNLPDKSIDIVVTSPPYNLGIKYSNYNDRRTAAAYLNWSYEWAHEVRRVLVDNGSFFLNLGSSPSNPLIPHELVSKLQILFYLQNTFHWIKSITVQKKDGELVSAGHFKPIHSKRFVNDCHEYIFHLTKTGCTPLDRLGVGVPYQDKSNIGRWSHTNGRDLRCRGNNWFVPYVTIKSRNKQRPHPATFPVELAEYCIRVHGLRPDLTMLDPFVGIGHSALAAHKCGLKRFIGYDVDAKYISVAKGTLDAARKSVKHQEGERMNSRLVRVP